MQYGFAYFYYLQNVAAARDLDWDQLWDREVDVDGSGYVDENELLTLTSMAKGKEPDRAGEDVAAMRLCLFAAQAEAEAEEAAAAAAAAAAARGPRPGGPGSMDDQLWWGVEKLVGWVRRAKFGDGTVRVRPGGPAPMAPPPGFHAPGSPLGDDTETTAGAAKAAAGPTLVTIKALVRCPDSVEGLRRHYRKAPTFTKITQLDEVAFEMIGDDFNHTKDQLNSIRARKTKFVCVNDDMKRPTPEMIGFLQRFYLSFFPYPSRFELPAGTANPTIYLDALQARARWGAAAKASAALAVAALALMVLWLSGAVPPDEDDVPVVGDGHAREHHQDQRDLGAANTVARAEGAAPPPEGAAQETKRGGKKSPNRKASGKRD
jgi:hypothetical protein